MPTATPGPPKTTPPFCRILTGKRAPFPDYRLAAVALIGQRPLP